MPLNRYFKGHGAAVKADMVKTYGPKKGERVFYATANAKGMNPKPEKRGLARLMP